jgi:hypothetical protein
MPTQDRVLSGQTMAAQCSGEPPREGGEHGPVRPVQTRQWVSAAQDSDLVAQHEELNVLGGGHATHCRIIPSTCEKLGHDPRVSLRHATNDSVSADPSVHEHRLAHPRWMSKT